MGILSFLLEKVFKGPTVERYLNSLKLREALKNLEQKHDFEVWMYLGDGECRTYYDATRPLEDFSEITVEIYAEENIRRIHIDYKLPHGFRRMWEHYGKEGKKVYFDYVPLTYIFLLGDKRVSDFVQYFIEIANRLTIAQKDQVN
jgi:hypothetical protein